MPDQEPVTTPEEKPAVTPEKPAIPLVAATPEEKPEKPTGDDDRIGKLETMLQELLSKSAGGDSDVVELSPEAALIKDSVDQQLEAMEDDDKALITAIAGEDPLSQFKTIQALQNAGKLGKQAPPPVGKPPAGGDDKPSKTKPKTQQEARAGLAKGLAGLKI